MIPQLEGLTYKPHPTFHFLFGTTDGRLYSSKTNKFLGNLRREANRVYVHIQTDTFNKTPPRYRLIWECFHGLLTPDIDIDHINCNSSDDRLCNLQAIPKCEHQRKTMRDNPGVRKKSGLTSRYTFQATREGEIIEGKDQAFLTAIGYSGSWESFRYFMRRKHYVRKYKGWDITLYHSVIMGEVWKTGLVQGKEYTASNMGRIKLSHCGGKGFRLTYGKKSTTADYRCVGDTMVHRIVCHLFHGPPPTSEHIEVDHVNEKKWDNRSANLMWVTKSENMQRVARSKRARLSSPMQDDVP